MFSRFWIPLMGGIHKAELSAAFFSKESGNKSSSF